MKTGLKNLVRGICLPLALMGCQTFGGNSDVPALIIQPDEASRSALRSTLSEIFGGRDITLADDALTRTSMLVLEPTLRQKLDRRQSLGRVVTKPFIFRLVKHGDLCILVDLRDDKAYPLTDTRCVAE